MPFWKREKEPPLEIPSSLRDFSADAVTAHIQTYLDSLLTRYTNSLKALSIPIPEFAPQKISVKDQTNFEYDPAVHITLPTFTLPPHLIFRVRQLTDDRWNFETDNVKAYLTYFLTADAQTIEQAYQEFIRVGLHRVVAIYPGQWLDRDPYGVYKYLHKKNRLRFPKQRWFVDIDPFLEVSKILPAKVDSLSFEQLQAMYDRAQFFIQASSSTPYPPARDKLNLNEDTIFKFIPEAALYEMPLSAPELTGDYIKLKILPSQDSRAAIIDQFLKSLAVATKPLVFEIVATADTIYFQLAFPTEARALIEQQIQTHFPSFAVLETEPPASPEKSQYTFWAWPRLADRPFNTMSNFYLDPYAQLFSILSEVRLSDSLSFQVVFAPVPNEALKMLGGISQGLRKKFPLWLTSVHLISTNRHLLEKLRTNFLSQYETIQAQFETSSINETQPFDKRIPAWNCVSTDELAALAHFPSKDIDCDLLETTSMKNKLPPDLYTHSGIEIGSSEARGITKRVMIPYSVRDRHVYVVGKSGTGKSTLLYNCICQDITAGSGVAVIDPHGDLVDDVLNYIPESRIKDTIYFNAADKEHPIGLNILNAQSEDEIGLLVDDLMVTFKRLSETWGERMDNILRFTFHTLLRYEGGTLLDIKPLLQEPEFREHVLASIKKPALENFWKREYPSYPKDAAQPILNRMSKFDLSPILSGILAQADSTLNFFDVLQNKKILLIRISKGEIGEDTAHLLGSLIVSQLQLAVMRRASLPKETRDPYYLYVDEFQNFTTSAFEKILSEARKYKLCLTLAHQYISQLDDKTKNATLANTGTIVMFQSYPQDAAALRPELGQYEPIDVTNLTSQDYEALCKPATQSKDTFKFKTLAPLKSAASYAHEIIEYTRENYAAEPSAPEVEVIEYETRPASPAVPKASLPPLIVPAKALPKNFASTGDKIIYYVTQAEYLSTEQIKRLCYPNSTPQSQASNASRDLKALAQNKKIKSQIFGSEKIYSTKPCNATAHNLAVRDIYTKIAASEFEIAEVSFFPTLGAIIPDLAVSFVAEDGQFIKTLWEYDAGTEGIGELVKKLNRYTQHQNEYQITFVFDTEQRLNLSAKALGQSFLTFAVLDQFNTLNDPAFIRGERVTRAPFFS